MAGGGCERSSAALGNVLSGVVSDNPRPGAGETRITANKSGTLIRVGLLLSLRGSERFVGLCGYSTSVSQSVSRMHDAWRAKSLLLLLVTRPEYVPLLSICVDEPANWGESKTLLIQSRAKWFSSLIMSSFARRRDLQQQTAAAKISNHDEPGQRTQTSSNTRPPSSLSISTTSEISNPRPCPPSLASWSTSHHHIPCASLTQHTTGPDQILPPHAGD